MPGNRNSGRRKPTQLKVFEGTARKDRQNDKEPEIEAAKMTPPAWLDKTAKAEWRRLTPYLYTAGILTRVDRGVFAAYCVAWSEFVRFQVALETETEVIEMKNGGYQRNPYFALRDEARKALVTLSGKLGLNPADRSQIEAAPPTKKGEEDPFESDLPEMQAES